MDKGKMLLAAALLAALLSALTGHPLCDLAFDCGCTHVFAGGDAHCDIHQPLPPNCPVCSVPAIGAAFAATVFAGWLGAVIAVRALARRVLRRRV